MEDDLGFLDDVVYEKVIDKTTHPNERIYIGKDLTNSLTYFGSVNNDLVAKDFFEDQMRDFSVR